jgi:hypothetical protein
VCLKEDDGRGGRKIELGLAGGRDARTETEEGGEDGASPRWEREIEPRRTWSYEIGCY